MSGHGGHIDASNKKVALLIAVLAALLAFSETGGKSAQTLALSENIEAANLWSFFQAKTIRSTAINLSAENAELQLPTIKDPKVKEAMEKKIEGWKATVARYDSEPEKKEGRKELAERAKEKEKHRDHEMAAYHHFELASAAFQIGIVLASAMVITGAGFLFWLAGGLGIVGIGFTAIAVLAPTAVHIF
jgi:hypothetical protein